MSKPFIPRYSRVPSHFWTDKTYSMWSDRVKLAGLYVTTCSHRHLEGIYTLPPEYACADLHWTMKNWKSALTILQESNFIKWDDRAKIILIIDALRSQAPENENQADGAIRRILDLPDSPLIKDFCVIALEHCTRKGVSMAAKLFVQRLLQQTGTQLPEQTPPLLPEQTQTQLEEQGRLLNLIPLTKSKPPTKQTPPPPPPKTDPIGRGQWKNVYGNPKDYGYD